MTTTRRELERIVFAAIASQPAARQTAAVLAALEEHGYVVLRRRTVAMLAHGAGELTREERDEVEAALTGGGS